MKDIYYEDVEEKVILPGYEREANYGISKDDKKNGRSDKNGNS